jgi:hypothetical protein
MGGNKKMSRKKPIKIVYGMFTALIVAIMLGAGVRLGRAEQTVKSYHVAATIPRIAGVNYFPEGYDKHTGLDTKKFKTTTEETTRNKENIVLKTSIEE